jgi:hypothetical protein
MRMAFRISPPPRARTSNRKEIPHAPGNMLLEVNCEKGSGPVVAVRLYGSGKRTSSGEQGARRIRRLPVVGR